MTLTGVLDSGEFEKLPEAIKGEYVKGEDEKYYLDVKEVDGWAFENTVALKSTAATERNRRKEWERKHGELKATLGNIDPSEISKIAEMKEEIEKMKQWTPEEKVSQRIKEIEKTYGAKLTAAERKLAEETSAKDSRIKTLITDTQARKALAGLDCLDSDLFLGMITRSSVVDDQNNVWPVDSSGNKVPSKKPGKVGDMDLAEWCEELKKSHPRNFKGSNSSGGGINSTGAGGPDLRNDTEFNKLSPEERIKRYRENKKTS